MGVATRLEFWGFPSHKIELHSKMASLNDVMLNEEDYDVEDDQQYVLCPKCGHSASKMEDASMYACECCPHEFEECNAAIGACGMGAHCRGLWIPPRADDRDGTLTMHSCSWCKRQIHNLCVQAFYHQPHVELCALCFTDERYQEALRDANLKDKLGRRKALSQTRLSRKFVYHNKFDEVPIFLRNGANNPVDEDADMWSASKVDDYAII